MANQMIFVCVSGCCFSYDSFIMVFSWFDLLRLEKQDNINSLCYNAFMLWCVVGCWFCYVLYKVGGESVYKSGFVKVNSATGVKNGW